MHEKTDKRSTIVKELLEGARAVMSDDTRRALLVTAALWNFFYSLIMPVMVIYALNTLNISPFFLGLTYLPGGIGILIASKIFSNLASRLGLGLVSVLGVCSTAIWAGLLALSSYQWIDPGYILMSATLFFGFGQALFGNASSSINQLITPPELIGRV